MKEFFQTFFGIGVIPLFLKYLAPKWDLIVRLQAGLFLKQTAESHPPSMNMVIGSGGLKDILQVFEEDYYKNYELIWFAIAYVIKSLELA